MGGGGGGGSGGSGGSAPSDGPRPEAGRDMGGVVNPPPDGGPPNNSACKYAPNANSTAIKLRFESIALMGVSTSGTNKGAGGPDGITLIQFIPGRGGEFLLMQKRGRVNHMKIEAGSTMATMIKTYDIAGVNITEDCGLISMAFDPDFDTNKLLYFGYCSAPKTTRLVRVTWDNGAFTDLQEIMSWNGNGGAHSWHSIGSLGFDKSGNLFVVHGEFTRTAEAQNINSNLGKLLRMVPSRAAGMGGYTVPADNPYASDPKPKSAIYAMGIRSPWRAFINANGQYFIGDVGDTTAERVVLATQKGQNFGWGGCSTGGCVGPITLWRGPQDPYDGDGNAVKEARRGRVVWAGTQYGDCGNDKYSGALTGVHIFGDFFAGWFRGMVIDEAGKKVKDVNLGDLSGVSSVAQSPDGFLYATMYGPYDTATTERPGMYRVLPQ
jgi:glucose/arabinose dehydrogenase